MLKLKITRYKTNEQYEAELDEYKKRALYGGSTRTGYYDYPQRETEEGILETFITEEQFEAIRKAVIEKF